MKHNRRKSVVVDVGGVEIGGENPIVVQSMTNTDTANIKETVKQIIDLAKAGSKIVRVTVDKDDAAKAVPEIKNELLKNNVDVPLVGDFHYNGHKLLSEFTECAKVLDKYRVNPGNVGFGEKKDRQFAQIVEIAMQYNKPIRIGVNWGSLDQNLLTKLMDENANAKKQKSDKEILRDAMVKSALLSADEAQKLGLGKDKIILSAKVSDVQELVAIYRELAKTMRPRTAPRTNRSRNG